MIMVMVVDESIALASELVKVQMRRRQRLIDGEQKALWEPLLIVVGRSDQGVISTAIESSLCKV